MEAIGKLEDAEAKVLNDARALLAQLGSVASSDPQTAEEAVRFLSELRAAVYEDLNQIQHEYMVLAAVRYLTGESVVPNTTEWQWNPRQTGGNDEPDLRGLVGQTVVVSAEVTTSARPNGVIADRMLHTLRKLSGETFLGQRYYFVRTRQMERQAQTFVQRERWPITVVCLPHPVDAS